MTSRSIPYRPDLDGLRAIAVMQVMASHAHIPGFDGGGDVGVTAFFVLSGYLITSLLLKERDGTGGISLRDFYVRRILRLGPALVLLSLWVALMAPVVQWPWAWQLGIVTSVFYASNWVQIAGININPLGHTWSLAIEEQFYLTWPLLLVFLGRRAGRIAIAGAIASLLLLWVSDGRAEYYSTLTRGGSILAGCLLAIYPWRCGARPAIAGLVALFVLGVVNLPHDLGLPAVTLAAIPVIAGRVPRLEALAPIGRRAYGLYLWNWPLTILAGPWGMPMTFVAAELSYRLVERPALRLKARLAARPPGEGHLLASAVHTSSTPDAA